MSLTFTIAQRNNCEVINIVGDLITKADSTGLVAAVRNLAGKQIVVNTHQLNHVASSGLGALINMLTITRNSGGDLVISAIPEKLQKLLVITKLTEVFTTFGTDEDAIGYFNTTK